MTQEQIEGSEIIAEFMDVEYNPTGHFMSGAEGHKYSPAWYIDGKKYLTSQLLYSSSFDWLIPACHKWDNLSMPIRNYDMYEILSDELDAAAALYEIKILFETLVHNIEWYNQNKQS